MMFIGWIWLVWNPSWFGLTVSGLAIIGLGAVIARDQAPEQIASGAALSAAIYFAVGAIIVAWRKHVRAKQHPLIRSLT